MRENAVVRKHLLSTYHVSGTEGMIRNKTYTILTPMRFTFLWKDTGSK